MRLVRWASTTLVTSGLAEHEDHSFALGGTIIFRFKNFGNGARHSDFEIQMTHKDIIRALQLLLEEESK